MKRLFLISLLSLSACTWITDAEHEARKDVDGDGILGDVDCDDEDATVGLATEWVADADGDGFGDPDTITEACEQPSGTVQDEGPGLDDCDDEDADVHPGADEICDEIDNDCDELVDDEDAEIVGADSWYEDADGDGYGNAFGDIVEACEQPSGYTTEELATDAEDNNADSYPGADEYCDEVDNDQDGEVDEDAVDASTWYRDADEDGYGDDSDTLAECEQPSGYVAKGGDCDDGDAAYNPGAKEDDCTDPNDYNCDGSTGYADDDGDGYAACEECDDTDASSYPGADEYCDGADNDCDGDIDEEPLDGTAYYDDGDGDGYGDADSETFACTKPKGAVTDDTDCDDSNAEVHPDAPEICDGIDNDCDKLEDDEDDPEDPETWYTDADGDGYGDPKAATVEACEQPTGMVDDDTDCDDAEAEVNPGADEVPGDACFDDVDNDCDGDVDEADGDCATCPDSCASTLCLWVDDLLEVERKGSFSKLALNTDTLNLADAIFDDVLLASGGSVLVHEDFSVDGGCFTGASVSGGVLVEGGASECVFSPYNAHLGDWVVSMTVVADSPTGSAELQASGSMLAGWYGWAVTAYLEDANGAAPFTNGTPDPAVDHHVVMCGTTP